MPGPYPISPPPFDGARFAARYSLNPLTDFQVINNQLHLRAGLVLPDDPPIMDPPFTAQEKSIQARAAAISAINANTDVPFKLFRAVVAIVLDEFNLHAAKHNAILTAIDNGSTLAQVKANIAAIQDYPTRTQAQLITAIENKINSGSVD